MSLYLALEVTGFAGPLLVAQGFRSSWAGVWGGGRGLALFPQQRLTHPLPPLLG